MDINDYQKAALRTSNAGHQTHLRALCVWALGLTGEAGEVADLVKKHVGHGHALNVNDVKKELGDVLWYVAVLAHTLNLDLSEVAEANIEKLRRRYPEGFDVERSKNRNAEKSEGGAA